MSKKFLVAVAWPYVNGDIHVGHLAGYLIPADIVARFQRLIGNDVMMVSGSDCHGTPITVEADKKGKTPKEIVDYYHKRDIGLFKKYNLSYNLYTKTTTENHKRVVQDLFVDLLNNGFITKKKEFQYYSEEDKKFLPDRYVEGECPHCHSIEQRSDQCENCGRMLEQGTLINPYSKLTKNTVTLRETEHYYIDLSKLAPDIMNYINEKKPLWRDWVYKEALGWIKEGLRPRAITRDLDWGIDIPINRIPENLKLDNFDGKKIYVWFEAVTGYLSAPQEWGFDAAQPDKTKKEIKNNEIIFRKFEGQGSDWKEWWKNDDAVHYYFLGQDNVVFHTILWQGQLLGANKGYHLPDYVSANKFMNYDGKKFSKSRNWIIDSAEIADQYGVDAVRYYISSNLPENKEGNFTWTSFYDAVNNELVANLGNFVNRTLVFLQNKFNGELIGEKILLDKDVSEQIQNTFKLTSIALNQTKIVDTLDQIMKLSAFGNKYFNDSELWNLIIKDEGKAQEVMFNLLQIVSALSILIEPFLPDTSNKLRQMLGFEELKPIVGKDYWNFEIIERIKLVSEVKPLIKKIEVQKTTPPIPKALSIDDIKVLLKPIRIVKILNVDKHPDADKLFVVQVSDGTNDTQIVAGAGNIKQGDYVAYLAPGNIVPGFFFRKNKKIVLEKRPLRGIESDGMILAEDEIGLSDKHEDVLVLDLNDSWIGKSILEYLDDKKINNILK